MWGKHNYNREAFNDAAAELRNDGHKVKNPAELDSGDKEEKPDSWYAKRCITMLMDCEIVLVLPGWEMSFGALMEIDIAYELVIPVRTYNESWALQKIITPHITTQARRLLCRSRNADYGDPRNSWGAIGRVWGRQPKKCVLDMALMKIQRELTNPKSDNLIDAIGYLIIADMFER
jgi:hypothetical protein